MSHEAAPESTPSTLTSVGWRISAGDRAGDGDTLVDAAAVPGARWSSRTGRSAPLAASVREASRLDGSRWCGWWRDLIVERYRVARFDQLVPLPGPAGCPWALRVGLGRVVERSLVGVHGPEATARLVADALDLAGFGVPAALDGSLEPRRTAMRGASLPAGAGDELRQGVLGSIADALLREVPPATGSDLDLRKVGSDGGCTEAAAVPVAGPTREVAIDGVIAAATRDAVSAYAGHVEILAERALAAVRAQRP